MDGAREIDIILEFLAETEDARAVNKEMQDIIASAEQASRATANMASTYSSEYGRWRHEQSMLTAEAKALQREMQYGWKDTSDAFRKALNDMVYVEYGYYKLAKAGADYRGTTQDMMQQISELGAEQKRINDSMINNDVMLRQSFMQTAGAMANMTTQAQRISDNYTRMQNPMYAVNQGNLRIADGLQKIAANGNAATLALEMLGPTAGTKQLNDMVMMINQGLMRFQFVAIGAAISSFLLYSTMHKLAMENEAYSSSLERMITTVKQAIQPMIDVFVAIMTTIFDFITSIAQLVIAFNEAHPTITKFIQGVMLLIPALTLVLSPLAIGIGLIAGYRAAWGAVWMFIGPLITGLAAMSATVWLVSAAIVGLTMVLIGLWKNNEGFRDAVIGAWQSIKDTAVAVFGFLAPYITTAVEGIKTAFSTLGSAVKSAFAGDITELQNLFLNIVPSLIAAVIGGVPGMILAASNLINAFSGGLQEGESKIPQFFTDVINKVLQSLSTGLPLLLEMGVAVITAFADGLTNNSGAILSALTELGTSVLTAIQTLLPILLEGLMSVIESLINGVIEMLPIIIELGAQLVMTLIEAILTALPLLLEVGLQLITTIAEAVLQNLPLLLTIGLDIIMNLITGILGALPMLLETALTLIVSFIATVLEALPQIITTGLQILTSLILGIIQALPQLVTTAINLMAQLVTTIIGLLPDILAAGIQILKSLVRGILDTVGELWAAAKRIGSDLIAKFKEIDLLSVGKDIMQGLVNGITEMGQSAIKAAQDVAASVGNAVKGFFKTASPSKLMIEIGGFVSEGLAIGITKDAPKVDDATMQMARQVTDNTDVLSANLNNDVANDAVSSSVTNSTSNVTFSPSYTINVSGGSDETGMTANAVRDAVDETLEQFFLSKITQYET